jgi:acetoacetate decarboxylase
LYTIWAGEAAVPDSEYRERVYYAGPEKHFNRDEYFNEVYNCYAEPSCQVIPDEEEVEEEPLEVNTEDEDEEVW